MLSIEINNCMKTDIQKLCELYESIHLNVESFDGGVMVDDKGKKRDVTKVVKFAEQNKE